MQYKKMLLLEFDNLIKKEGVKNITFSCEDNPKIKDKTSISMNFTFNELKCFPNPDIVVLKSGDNVLTFHRVKHILTSYNKELNYRLIKIVCEVGDGNSTEEVKYTLVAI